MSEKTVRITLELPSSFLNLLNVKATLAGWTKYTHDAPEPRVNRDTLDAGGIIGWLVLMEACGHHETLQHASTPMMWRQAGGPEVIHEERRVYEDGKLIAGPNLEVCGAT